ncbi:hypothetical protein LX24_00451 [Desulfallas thermosapovorans DSM 6562]|uniref:Uncharacterized protein n=2 Tax=Desulfallas thermosapovorans TaxID=58137 RepID=A0A5S4ZW91_9FIRM|nr:hypothetical protein LX24_00451 [Desulfallas thermosapovorans DSM 6562]
MFCALERHAHKLEWLKDNMPGKGTELPPLEVGLEPGVERLKAGH